MLDRLEYSHWLVVAGLKGNSLQCTVDIRRVKKITDVSIQTKVCMCLLHHRACKVN